MEKYRSSADPSTGVHPFMPAAFPSTFALVLGGLFLIPIRLPLFIVSLLLFLTLGSLPTVFSLLGVRPLARLFQYFSGLSQRGLLLSFGIVFQPPSSRSSTTPRAGDVLYVNHCSYLDFLYLSASYGCTFLIAEGEELYLRDALSAIRGSGGIVVTDVRTAALRSSLGPVAILAEGARTNGKGVLSFVRVLRDGAKDAPGRVFGVGMRYSAPRTETFTVGLRPAHALRLMACIGLEMSARTKECARTEDVQIAVAGLAGLPALRIGREAHDVFVRHWEATRGGVSSYEKRS